MQAFLQKYHIQDEVLAVGVSGGADSMALALMLREELSLYGKKIVALTIDHHLRPSSSDEAQYVAKVMQKFGIEHHILEWQGPKPKTNIESVAREARYELLCNWCKSHHVGCLFMAHHCQDQAETFLIRLQRGSGLDGLCAMRAVTEYKGIKILRPLLNRQPQELQAYLQEKQVKWITDESNSDKRFLRNKIRSFLPQLEVSTGISVEKICNAVTHLQSSENYIQQQVEELLSSRVKQYSETVVCFQYADFLSWHSEMKFRVLAQLCRQNYVPRSESVLRLIQNLCHLPFTGSTLGQKEIFLSGTTVWILPEIREKIRFKAKDWHDFVMSNPEYNNVKLPHKVKRALLMEKKIDL